MYFELECHNDTRLVELLLNLSEAVKYLVVDTL